MPGSRGFHFRPRRSCSHRYHHMPLYFFSVRNGVHAGVCDDGAEFPDRGAAWKEMTGVCGDVVGDISRKLGENGEWAMELLDESRKPVFRIRLVAETLD